MYKPEHFQLEELVPKDLWLIHSRKRINKLFLLFDDRILRTADMLRVRFGPLYCNTWKNAGNFNYRGFRPFNSTVGSTLSQHKFGRALDLVPVKVTAEEIRQDIIANPTREIYKHIRAIEEDVSWLHIDCRNYIHADEGIFFFHK